MRGSREQIQWQRESSFRVIRWQQSVSSVELLAAPGKIQRLSGEGTHWHYHTAMELTHFATGGGTRFVGDHIGSFEPGDVVLLGGQLPHYWHVQGPSSGLAAQWSFPPEHPFWVFPETAGLNNLFERAGRGVRYTGRTAALVAAGLQKLGRVDGAERLGTLLLLFGLMHHAPATDQTVLSTRSFSLPTEAGHQQAMRQAVRYLLANYRDEIRLEELLKLTRMSKATFSRQFKRHAGKSFSDFVSRVRLQSACRELVETDRTVIEVALACGFNQISFFNRLFRRVFGCAPKQYRERQRKASKEHQPPKDGAE